jgi:methionyl-tRNA formyltransferase
MLMDAGMDTGPVLAQEQEHILPSDTTPVLSGRLASLAAGLLTDTLSRWLAGSISPQPQDNALATYSRIIQKEDGEIPWERPAREISRRIRAFLPWPACYTWYEGKMLKVLKALPLAGRPGCVPGRVVSLSPDQADGSGVGIETGDGVLALQLVQIEGKKEMPASVFARSHVLALPPFTGPCFIVRLLIANPG